MPLCLSPLLLSLQTDMLPGVDLALAIEETQKTLSLMYNRYEVKASACSESTFFLTLYDWLSHIGLQL